MQREKIIRVITASTGCEGHQPDMLGEALYEQSYAGPVRLKILSLVPPADVLVFMIILANVGMNGEGCLIKRKWFEAYGVSEYQRRRAFKSLESAHLISRVRASPGQGWRVWLACDPWPKKKPGRKYGL